MTKKNIRKSVRLPEFRQPDAFLAAICWMGLKIELSLESYKPGKTCSLSNVQNFASPRHAICMLSSIEVLFEGRNKSRYVQGSQKRSIGANIKPV